MTPVQGGVVELKDYQVEQVAIRSLFPTGYAVVVHGGPTGPAWAGDAEFERWLAERSANSTLAENHPFRYYLRHLRYVIGLMVYRATDHEDAMRVYETFTDPDKVYVTFWQNGVMLHENT